MKIYIDHAATTPVRLEAAKTIQTYLTKKFGNPSSLHSFGREAGEDLAKAREKIAKIINADSKEIFFTSGGTESDNLAIKGIAYANKQKGNHIITCKIEHPAILQTCKALEKEGFAITYLDVDNEGLVNPKEVERAITNKTILVSIMHANNEIGTLEPIEEIGKICRKKNIYFHTDAVQTFCKEQIDVKKMNIDSLSASSHKIYGPKGVGLAYIRRGTNLQRLIHGGGQERGIRSGTENVPGILGFVKAAELANKEMPKERQRLIKLRDKLIRELKKMGAILNGHPKKRLVNNVNISFSGIEGEAMILNLDNKGIAASTGSACSTKSLEPSHVLLAIGLKPINAHASLRFTLGKSNNSQQLEYIIKNLKQIIKKLKSISMFK